MDSIIELCDRTINAAWPLPNLAKILGTDLQHKILLNELYGMIRRRLDVFCNLPFGGLGKLALQVWLDEPGYPALENA